VLLTLLGLAEIAGAEIGLRVRVTYEVVDEEGKPVADAVVYSNPGLDQPEREGRTDANGRYTEEVRSLGDVGVEVTKEGYYPSGIGIDDLWSRVPPGVEVRRRFPDVTVRGVLRPIGNPVPMYAYKFSGGLPVEDQEVGFDFLKAGWVKPYGRGEVADMLVRIKTQNPEEFDNRIREIHIRFPNPGDGMVRVTSNEWHSQSRFSMPRMAPEKGYIAEWREIADPALRQKRGTVYEPSPEGPPLSEACYFIRIRTQLNEKGEVIGGAVWSDWCRKGAFRV